MSVAETMKAITDCAKKLIEAPRYNVGDFVGVYGYETDVRIHDIRREGSCFTYKVYLADEETWLYDDDIAYKKDEMIEGLVEETKPNIIEEAKTYWDSIKDAWICPQGYQFVDENSNVINAAKIVLEKKKKEYPKTYEECAEIIAELTGSDCNPKGCMGYMSVQLTALQKLLICRDAYWKLYGEEMGLGKPWENGRCEVVYSICRDYDDIVKQDDYWGGAHIFEFPIREMRDAFYENFKKEIEICKEFL